MAVNAADVKRLRDKTDLPMMDCKAALSATEGDFDAAIAWLHEKFKGKMSKREDRETAQGRVGVFVSADGQVGALVELRCETAPVAKNDYFLKLSNKVAEAVALSGQEAPSPEAILDLTVDGQPVSWHVQDTFSRLQESTKIQRAHRLTGDALASYVHHDGTVGCLVAISGGCSQPEAAKDLGMHVASMKPKFLRRDQVPAEEVDQFRASVKAELVATGKPEAMHDKIIEGKLGAFYGERVLPEQPHCHPKYENKKVLDTLKPAGATGISAMLLYIVGGQ